MIEIDKLSVKDYEGKLLLEELDLKINRGETTLICGEPGSGKTILLKAVKGILGGGLKTEGEIKRKGRIGIVFQEPEKQIVRRNVRLDAAFELENRGLPLDEIKDRIKKYSKMLKADHLLNRDIEELSHGELTKVALLSTMVTEPEIILLDEPLSPLDHKNQKIVLESIKKLKKEGITIVIAEHDIRDLYGESDRVILLKDGKIDSTGGIEEMSSTLIRNGIKLPFELELKAHSGGDTL